MPMPPWRDLLHALLGPATPLPAGAPARFVCPVSEPRTTPESRSSLPAISCAGWVPRGGSSERRLDFAVALKRHPDAHAGARSTQGQSRVSRA